MNNKVGILKTKILKKLTESYTSDNKSEMKNILKLIKENKDFKEMYLFYEEIENKYISDKETAKLYVEGLSTMLNNPTLKGNKNNLEMFCKSLDKTIGDVSINENELYSALDILSEKDALSNIEKKVISKKKLVEHLTTKKEINESKESTLVPNENLLNAILTSNFNALYSKTLSESEKEELKNILSIPHNEIESKTVELKESIINQVSTLINEANDNDLLDKLKTVKDEVVQMQPSRYNYFRLNELKNGLN
jgi:hypothetical protein